MKRLAGITWVSTAVVAVGAAALWFVSAPTLSALSKEDGFVEWGTALCYFAAAGIFFYAGNRPGLARLWSWGLGALMFLIAGEEISWGQRIFHVATPAELNQVNVQHELNLHNINGLHQHVRMLGVLFILGVCFGLPLAHRFFGWARALVERFSLPVLPLWALPTVTVALLYMVAPRLEGLIVFELDEVGEWLLSMGWLAFAVAEALARPKKLPAMVPSPVVVREP